MKKEKYESYFMYLSQRSALGYVYRTKYLYPRISKQLHGTVLDVGCGIGDFLKFTKNAIGIDINPFNVEYCCKNGLVAYLIDNDVFPFPDKSFDSVILDNVLEHIADPKPTLEEVSRVIRPSGTLVIGVPGEKGYAADPDHKLFYDEAGLVGSICNGRFIPQILFHMPWKSTWLNKHIRQYCIYGVFKKIGVDH